MVAELSFSSSVEALMHRTMLGSAQQGLPGQAAGAVHVYKLQEGRGLDLRGKVLRATRAGGQWAWRFYSTITFQAST
jgi:hypothetical protein